MFYSHETFLFIDSQIIFVGQKFIIKFILKVNNFVQHICYMKTNQSVQKNFDEDKKTTRFQFCTLEWF